MNGEGPPGEPLEGRDRVNRPTDRGETFILDEIVEAPVPAVLERHGANVSSEEAGWIDRGSAVTVVTLAGLVGPPRPQ